MRGLNQVINQESAAPRQTVPRSGSWLHTFKVSKNAESLEGLELPETLSVGQLVRTKEEVKQELLSAVSSVIFPSGKVSARKTFGSPAFLRL